MQDTIVVLDFGAQYSQLIARRIRETGVYSKILPYNTNAKTIKELNPKGIIFSGGPKSVNDKRAPFPDTEIFSLGIPILGICYGLQLIAKILKGEVVSDGKREYGRGVINIKKESLLFQNVKNNSVVWMSHGDSVKTLPPSFSITAATDNCSAAAAESENIYGVQFHPEVVHTEEGRKIIENFCTLIAKAEKSWSMDSFIERKIEEIREEVKGEKVILALSGGVDSSVAALLIHRAIGNLLTCVFVNNGMLRKGEVSTVMSFFKDNLNVYLSDAEEEFLNALKGVTEPEDKRKIIGKVFIDVFRKEEEKLGPFTFLAQGTLYPDVIESKSPLGGPSATIKSHHNVGGLPKDLSWKILEPLSELFKDEVREIGRKLDLPDKILMRHPFPGPGLGVRCVGEVTKERLETLRDADYIFTEEIKKADLYGKIWQAFAVLLPVKSVGVQGDERTYKEVCVLRAVTSDDAMTADFYRFPYEVLEKTAVRICNEVKGINRVLYDITSKPPGTIEFE